MSGRLVVVKYGGTVRSGAVPLRAIINRQRFRPDGAHSGDAPCVLPKLQSTMRDSELALELSIQVAQPNRARLVHENLVCGAKGPQFLRSIGRTRTEFGFRLPGTAASSR